jgi:GNAT superfamily N-acetyltransferase
LNWNQRPNREGTIQIRFATVEDAETLGALNVQLIRDEGHRNAMTIPQLVHRMAEWLRADYDAAIADDRGAIVGYALFRRDAEYVYLRQIFVRAESRRRGIGRNLFQWLLQNAWQAAPRIRIDVLVGNEAGRRFWESIGFQAYCLTMEMGTPNSGEGER